MIIILSYQCNGIIQHAISSLSVRPMHVVCIDMHAYLINKVPNIGLEKGAEL